MTNSLPDGIKSTLSMQDVALLYGFEPNRAGSILCPFHQEKTPSLKVYSEIGRGWHCFGCGKGGSVIDFVMLLFDIPFRAACVRLNADFNLGLPIGDHLTASQRAAERKEVAKRVKQVEAAKAAREYREHRYWLLMDDWIASDINRRKYALKSPDEEFHPLFVEAIKNIDHQSYLIDLYS